MAAPVHDRGKNASLSAYGGGGGLVPAGAGFGRRIIKKQFDIKLFRA